MAVGQLRTSAQAQDALDYSEKLNTREEKQTVGQKTIQEPINPENERMIVDDDEDDDDEEEEEVEEEEEEDGDDEEARTPLKERVKDEGTEIHPVMKRAKVEVEEETEEEEEEANTPLKERVKDEVKEIHPVMKRAKVEVEEETEEEEVNTPVKERVTDERKEIHPVMERAEVEGEDETEEEVVEEEEEEKNEKGAAGKVTTTEIPSQAIILEKEISNGPRAVPSYALEDAPLTNSSGCITLNTDAAAPIDTRNFVADIEEQPSLAAKESEPYSVGPPPTDDYLKSESDFQSQNKLEQEIQHFAGLTEDHAHEIAPRERPPQNRAGGDGDLSDSVADISDKSNSRINFRRSIGRGFTMGSTGNLFKVSKFTTNSKSEIWSPSSFITRTEKSSYQNSNEVKLNGTVEYSTFSKPRPVSMPPSDYNIQNMDWKISTSIHNGRAHSEEKTLPSTNANHDYHRLLKVVQPPPDIDQMEILLSRKKMFSSSSFYEEPHHKYPTVEEQVELCRKIADSLSADSNRLSKGASMYSKRKKRADKWVYEGPDPENEPPNNQQRNYSSSPDIASYPHQVDGTNEGFGRRKLKLVLDPRQLQDAMKLRNSGLYNEHNVISPDICFDLVKDLNSPTGKGAALFAKRKKKSEKWIVDETTVKQHEHKFTTTNENDLTRFAQESKSTNFETRPISALDKLVHQRLKLVKSPWEAALESPIGSCEAAFQEVRHCGLGGLVADTLLKRAEEYTQFPHLVTVPPPPASSSTSYLRPFTPTESRASASPLLSNEPPSVRSVTPTYSRLNFNLDIYKPKAPRGWGGHTTDYLPITSIAADEIVERPTSSPYSTLNLGHFADFNQKAKLWTGESGSSTLGFRPVRPPSVILK